MLKYFRAIKKNVKNSVYMLKIIAGYSRLYLFTYAVLTLIDGVFPLVGLYMPKMLIDKITNGVDRSEIFILLGIFLVISLVYFIFTYIIRGKYLQPKSDMLFNYIALMLKKKWQA